MRNIYIQIFLDNDSFNGYRGILKKYDSVLVKSCLGKLVIFIVTLCMN